MKNLNDVQAISRDGMEAAAHSLNVAQQGAQTIAAEFADYARRSVEQSAAAFEKMSGANSAERVVEAQQALAKDVYDSFVAQAAKFSEIYSNIARESFRPFEDAMNKMKPKG